MKLIEKVVKKHIQELNRISDNFEGSLDYIRLHKKERLLPFDDNLFKKFKESITSRDLSYYYDLEPTYKKLSEYLGVNKDQLLLGAGSEQAMKYIFEACVDKSDNIILHSPAFAMFKIHAQMFGAEVKSVPLKDDWYADIDKMLSKVDDKTKLLVIENPNGSSGTCPTYRELEYCASELNKRNVLFLIDEAYYYAENIFSESHKLILKYPNVIIGQTFSKIHGLAGVRFGYIIGHPEVISYIKKVKPIDEISSLSSLAGNWVLDNPVLLENYRKSIKESKEYLAGALTEMGIAFKDAKTNFILIDISGISNSSEVYAELKNHKILVKPPFTELPLKGWMLVSVGTLESAKIFIETLGKLLKQNKS